MSLHCLCPLITIYALVVKNVILILTMICEHLTKSALIILAVIDMVTLFKIQNEIIESCIQQHAYLVLHAPSECQESALSVPS